MKKLLALLLVLAMAFTLLAACTEDTDPTPTPTVTPEATAQPAETTPEQTPEATPESNFNTSREITVVSRESGSGTRGAFVELTGVEETVDGNTTDRTSAEAVVANGTSAIMTNIAGDEYAIGYISMGSVDDTIKPISIDGVEPTAANILAGDYPIARPFIIVTLDDLDDAAQDFINFIMSKEGQDVVADKYISIDAGASAFQTNGASGTVVVGGSTSVAPVMESLAEAYQDFNSDVSVEIHATGSGAGITGTIDGVVDIGMSSRNIKESEMEDLYQEITIAMDGIAVIVNNGNPLSNLTMDKVRDIFIGEITKWSEVQ